MIILFFIFYLFIFGSAESSLLCRFSLVVASWGYSLVVVHGLLILVASLVAEHRLKGFSCCGSQALEHGCVNSCDTWD